MKPLFRLSLIASVTLALTVGCATEETASNAPSGPRVFGLAKNKLVVGEPMNILGAGFLNTEDGEGVTKLVFDGVFIIDGESSPPIAVDSFTITPLLADIYTEDVVEQGGALDGRTVSAGTTVLRWNRFGPFAVPFGPGNKPGTFNGTVRPMNFYADGSSVEGEATEVVIKVEPSIIVTRLEPITGYKDGEIKTPRCGAPALRGHGGMPYVMEVEAVGFEPKFFRYEFSGVQHAGTGPLVVTHQATGRTDRVGDPLANPGDVPIVFDSVDDTMGANIATIRVIGVTADNQSYEMGLPLRIVRAMAIHHDGKRQVAEYYEPVQVGGTKGSIGTTISYSETETETRQRGVSMTVSKSFVQNQNSVASDTWSEGISEGSTSSVTNSQGVAHSESQSSQESYGQQVSTSEASAVNFSSSEGDTWGWNTVEGKSESDYEAETKELFGEASASVNTTVGAEGSVPGFAKVSGSVGTTVGATVGAKTGGQTATTQSYNESTGSSMGGSVSETESFGSTTTDAKSQSFQGTFAVASQASINSNTAKSDATSNSKTFSVGGTASVSEGVSEGSSETWTETYVDTKSQSSTLATSASVPSGACARVMRQTIRYARVAQIYTYDLCGVRSLVGETIFTEWGWTSEIPIGKTCEEALPDFPKAECFIGCD